MHHLRTLLLITLFLACGFVSAAEGYTRIEGNSTLTILTPSLSQRESTKIRLDNGLEAYIISDPDVDKSAAALAVQVGSWSNPQEHAGIAHFLEHMLFLGTTKYPEESGYQRYLTDHGGRANAYTSVDHTSYIFDIDPTHFDGALDRFAWFFREPLFNPSGVARELQIIDQEFEQYRNNDHVREVYALKALANKDHPYHRFNVGNKATLEHVSEETLRDFYEGHYSANLMHLVIIDRQPLNTLVDMVVDRFGPIKDKGYTIAQFPQRLFSYDMLGKTVYIQPLKDQRSLGMMWELPSNLARQLDTRSEDVISYVLGHEGEESLLAELKREGLATGLSAGGVNMGTHNLAFNIDIELTEEGMKQIDQVAERVHQAITYLKQNGIPSYIFDEMQRMDTLTYQFQERQSSYHSASEHARAMLYEPLDSYPLQTKVIQEYAPKLVTEVLTEMRPERCIYAVLAPDHVTGIRAEKSEPWFNTEYAVADTFGEQMDAWKSLQPHPAIAVPTANPFIPTDLQMLSTEVSTDDKTIPTPEVVVDDSQRGRVLWAQDHRYLVPKVCWLLKIRTPQIRRGDTTSEVLAELYLNNLADQLNAYRYQATLAGLDLSAAVAKEGGIDLQISGYSEKALQALETLFASVTSKDLFNDRFDDYRDTLYRKYENFAKETPLTQASELLKSVVYEEYSSAADKAAALKRVTRDDLQVFVNTLYDASFLEATLYGNCDKQTAMATWEAYSKHFNGSPYPRSAHSKVKVAKLADNKGPYYLKRTRNVAGNGLILAIHNGRYDFDRRAAHQILGKSMEEPFFSDLRTKQKTGYIVYNVAQEMEQQLYTFLAVQSGTHHLRDLLARFELFLEGYLQEIDKDAQASERFEMIKNSYIAELRRPPKNLDAMANMIHELAIEFDSDFEWMDKRIQGFKDLTFEQYVANAKEFIGRNNRKRMALMVQGKLSCDVGCDYKRAHSIDRLRKYSAYLDREEASAI